MDNASVSVVDKLAFAAGQEAEIEEYWLNQLSGDLENSGFPYDFKKIDGNKPLVQTCSFKLTGEEYSLLMKMSNGFYPRLHMLLIAGMVSLLFKYTGNMDIIVGTSIYKQDFPGEFINTILALRYRLESNMTFKELVLQSRRVITGAVENQNYPIELIIQELGIPYGINDHFPLFDIAILLENIQDKAYIQHINPLMAFFFLETGDSVEAVVEYNSRLYKKETIERLLDRFKYLFHQVLANVDLPLAHIDLLTEKEKRQLLIEFNQTETAYPKHQTITGLFQRQVEKTPDHIAVFYENKQITYSLLNKASHKMSRILIEKGVKPEAIVLLMAGLSLELIVGIMGILKTGAAYLPLNPELPAGRVEFILKDSGAATLVMSRYLIDEKKNVLRHIHTNHIISLGDETIYYSLADIDDNQPDGYRDPGQMAYIIYTSGTTGKPKGVIVDHQGLVNYISWAANQYVKNEKVNFPLFTSVSFDLTVTSIFTPLITGNAIIVYGNDSEAKEILIKKIIDENRVGVVKLTPSHLKLIENDSLTSSCNKRFIVGGENLESQLAKKISQNYSHNIEIYNEYGPTETVVGCMCYLFNHNIDTGESVPLGAPIANMQIYILDSYRTPIPPGIVGEIYISGDGLARGYLNRPELTAEKFRPLITLMPQMSLIKNKNSALRANFQHSAFSIQRSKLYCTGDLARWMPGGNIEYLGRIDQQVKIRGYRIELREIENQIMCYEGIKEAVVISKEDKNGDRHIRVYIIANYEINISDLKKYLFNYLPDYMIPSYFFQLEKIPLTANGKIDRGALPEPELKAGKDYIGPQNEIEKKLVDIWRDVLSQPQAKIGINDNFFELGGHSLKATIMVSKIHKDLNVHVHLAEIFKHPTIRDLAEYIKGMDEILYTSIEPVEEKEYYELSSAQKRLYILQQMDMESVTYNIPVIISLPENVHISKLEESFKKLIKRHESLRTSFHMINDVPVQRIHDEIEFEIEYDDLAVKNTIGNKDTNNIEGLPKVCGPTFFQKNKFFMRPFKLSNAPLIRVGLLKTEEGSHLLLVDLHHIITDGISQEVLEQDFMMFYKGETLPSLQIQYKDFVAWQNRNKEKEILKKQEVYWLKEFERKVPILNIPNDYPRPALQSFEGNNINFEMSNENTRRIMEYAREQGVTLYMMLLAIVNILLSKLSGQEDIVIGTPVAGRKHADLEKVIGMFVNTLSLRNFPNGEKSFVEFLEELKKRTLEAFENQEWQFEDIVEKVVVDRDMSRNPLFDVMFVVQNIKRLAVDGFENKEAEKNYENINHISKFDLTITVWEQGQGLKISFGYCTKLFKEETIKRFMIYFYKIVTKVLEDIGIKISEIEIITEEEKNQILYDFNNTIVEYPQNKTIHRLFEEQAERTPNNIAVVDPFVGAIHKSLLQITYQELNEKSYRLAHLLQIKGVGHDIIVGIIVERSVEMVIGLLGILKSGGAYLPIDPNNPQERIDFMLKDSEAKLMITGNDLKNVHCPLTSHLLNPNYLTAISLAYVIYTSGSSGKPKGVLIQHQGIVNFTYFHQEVFRIRDFYRASQVSSQSFDAMAFEIWPCFSRGIALCIAPNEVRMDPSKMKDWLLLNRITASFQPTVIALHLLDEEWPKTGTALKILWTAGDRLTRFLEHPYPFSLYNLYGPTEDTVWTTWIEVPVSHGYNSFPSIGKPIANHKVYILGKNSKFQPIGITGELCILSIGTARGYLNQPEFTAEKFISLSPITNHQSPLYKTGDLGRLLSNGTIEFLGRIDYQVKIRGFRIELGEIEHLLLSQDEIKASAVIAIDEKGENYLCAYFVSDKKIEIQELRDNLAKKLPNYMIPSYFKQIESMPMTISGKINRKALALLDHRGHIGKEFVEPQNEMEKKIAQIWKELLGLEKVGIRDNFFEIGGNSLKVITLNSKLSALLQTDLPVAILYRYVSIEAFVKYLTVENNASRGFNLVADRSSKIIEVRKSRERRKERRRMNSNV